MDLQHFQDVDWNAPDNFLATLRGVSKHWIMSALMDVAYYLMAQGVTGRLAPILKQERRYLQGLEQRQKQKQSEWEAAVGRIEVAKAELAQPPQPATFEQEQAVRQKISQASQEAALLATELTRFDEPLKQQRDKVRGMGVVLDRLLAATLPELGEHLELAEFLASISDEDDLPL